MTEANATETAPNADTGAGEWLDDEVSRLAATLGIRMDAIATDVVGDCAEAHTADLSAAISELRVSHGLATSVAEARDQGASRPEAFASGAVHAIEQVLAAYTDRLRDQDNDAHPPDTEERPSDRLCTEMGRTLADLRFAVAWRLLAGVQAWALEEGSTSGQDYIDGIAYGLKRAITSFRAQLEERADRVLAREAPSDAERQLATLLFIAVTGATARQVEANLGSSYGPIVAELDQHDYINCGAQREHPPLRVTPHGAALAHHLARDFESTAA